LRGEWIEDLADHTGIEGDYRIVFYHTDHLGTPRVLTDEMGAVISEHALYPFGEEVPGPWSLADSSNTHWFTGHERDLGVGGDYMLARYYSAFSGRFSVPDPSREPWRIPGFSSRYVYVNESPMSFADPTGRDAASRTCNIYAGAAIVLGTVSEGIGLLALLEGDGGSLSFTEFTAGALATTAGIHSLKECERLKFEHDVARNAVDSCLRTRKHDDCVAAKSHCRQLEGSGEPGDAGKCARVEQILREEKQRQQCELNPNLPCPLPPDPVPGQPVKVQ